MPKRSRFILTFPWRPAGISALFFLSGLSGLIYQNVWTQQFALIFGATAPATTAVLAAFMGGLALGAALAARWARHVSRPLRAYALLEVGVALAALVIDPALEAVRSGNEIRQAMGLDASSLQVTYYLASSFVILAIPTCMMGATLPLLVRVWSSSNLDQSTGGVAALYMINTIGAAAGALTAGFWLIPGWGLGTAIHAGVGINLLVALAAYLLSGPPITTGIAERHRKQTGAPPGNAVMYLLVFVSGFTGLAYEVLWTRLLTHPMGGSLYAFATMLAAYLTGIGAGALAAARLGTTPASARLWFGLAQVGVAVCGVATLAFLNTKQLLNFLSGAQGVPGGTVGVMVTIATLVPGALFLGAAFPLGVRAVTSEDASGATGRVYAWNTLGAIAGAIGCGFLLLPMLQYARSVLVLAAVSLLAAAVSIYRSNSSFRWVSMVPLVAIGMLAAVQIEEPWNILNRSPLSDAGPRQGPPTFYAVGSHTNVTLTELGPDLRLSNNGLPESAIQGRGARLQKFANARWLGILPVAARPQAESAIVVGLGAGITLAAIPDSIKRIDVLELEEEVVNANRSRAAWRQEHALDDERVHLTINDARTFLADKHGNKADIAISQPSHPWTVGAANLFTREFFELVEGRLADNGVFLQWLGVRYISVDLLRSQLATLGSVFDYVELFNPPNSGAVFLLASNQPLAVLENLSETWPTLKDDWELAGVHAPQIIAMSQWLDARSTADVSAGARLTTDLHNRLMIESPRVIAQPSTPAQFRELLGGLRKRMQCDLCGDELSAIRYFIKIGDLQRANHLLLDLPDGPSQSIARALLDLARGNTVQAMLALQAILNRDPTNELVLGTLLNHYTRVPTGVPANIAYQLEQNPSVNVVLQAWRAARLNRFEEVRVLDEQLASFDGDHPLFELANRLRATWRVGAQDESLALEGVRFVDRLIGDRRNRQLLILRARLGVAARSSDIVFASLLELLGGTGPIKPAVRLRLEPVLNMLARQSWIAEDQRWQVVQARIGHEA